MILFYECLATHVIDLKHLGLAVRLLHLLIKRLLPYVFQDQHLCLLVTFFAEIMTGLESWFHHLNSHCLSQRADHSLREF